MSRALKIVAYSTPITPPPITAILLGARFIFKISSLSKIETPSKGTNPGLYGLDPVAIINLSDETTNSSSSPEITFKVYES